MTQAQAAPEPGSGPLLLVVDSLDAGGAERHVVDLATALAARGRQVHLACSARGPLAPALEGSGVALHVLGGDRVKRRACPAYAWRLRALVADLLPAVVHAHVHASEVAAARAVRGVPLVVTEHTEAPWRTAGDRADAAQALRSAARVLAVSRAVADRVVRELGVRPDRVEVVLPAVPPVGPAAGRPARGGPVVGFVGRLTADKGVDVLLRAHAGLRTRGVALRVVGDGPERARLRTAAGPDVALLGFRPDARALLVGVDVLAVPSLSDGSPLVVAEANAAGVPVVASDVGGLPDRVRHGVDGLLVPPGDVWALREALDRLLGDPALRARLAAAGRARAARETHAAMVTRLEAVYDEVRAAAATASHSLWRTGVV